MLGRFAAVDAESVSYIFSYRTDGDDAIVLLAVQRLARQTKPADTQLSGTFGIDISGEFDDDVIDPSVVSDHFEHTSGQ